MELGWAWPLLDEEGTGRNHGVVVMVELTQLRGILGLPTLGTEAVLVRTWETREMVLYINPPLPSCPSSWA